MMDEQQPKALSAVPLSAFMQSERVCPSSSCWSYLASPENNMTQTHRLPELKMCPIIQWQMVFPGLPLPRVIPASERQLPGTPALCFPRTGCTRSRCCPADGSWSQSSSCSGHCSAGSAAVSARKAWLKAGRVAPCPGLSAHLSTRLEGFFSWHYSPPETEVAVHSWGKLQGIPAKDIQVSRLKSETGCS